MTTVEQQREQIWVAPEAPVVTPAVTTRDVLHRAADLLEEFGWCQDDYFGGATAPQDAKLFCAVGAVARARHDFGMGHRRDRTPAWAAEKFLDDNGVSAYKLSRWNDAPERTRAEVVARLREAAEASHE